MNIFTLRPRYGTAAFLSLLLAVVALFLFFSDSLVKDLALQERARMQIWADATRQILTITEADDGSEGEVDFLLSIIEGNTTIPVLLTDERGNIIMHRNFKLPERPDSLNPLYTSPANEAFLRRQLAELSQTENVIHIVITPGLSHHIYYKDSALLRSLSLFPYVQLSVMAAFIFVVYFAVSSSKRAEQNKVWVGLSKETAHQLGTPISSLMAWTEYMRSIDLDPEMVNEIDKDVNRLSTIASRFSKIGSKPQMEASDLNEVIAQAARYMKTRISNRIDFSINLTPQPLMVMLSAPLMEWVMENLIKNAVDAMEARGNLSVATLSRNGMAVVTVTDSGKGLSRKMFKEVFRPGFTTKKRGWGLGLTLAKRIVEQYHRGRIFVAASEPGVATIFCIEIPLLNTTQA